MFARARVCVIERVRQREGVCVCVCVSFIFTISTFKYPLVCERLYVCMYVEFLLPENNFKSVCLSLNLFKMSSETFHP